MNFDVAQTKITNISKTAKGYIDAINTFKTDCIDKVNARIEDLENTINTSISLYSNNNKTINAKIEKISKDINDRIGNFNKRVNKLINDLTKWYNEQIDNTKTTVICSTFSKIGQPIDKEIAKTFADAIPNPSIESIIPDFSINFDIDEYLKTLPTNTKINLPRL